MTVRKLINSLLDSNMDKNVKLYLPDYILDERFSVDFKRFVREEDL